MKVLVFAHIPPPHHGQSYMVQLMLEGFGGDRRERTTNQERHAPNSHHIACYHVNARVSKQLEDIGEFRLGKFLLLLGYCLEAIWCRFRHGVENFYFIPAPGKRSALYRDWLVMLICRPFFKRVILHWHAAGLAKWLETVVNIRSRAITYHLMKEVDLSIVLSYYNRADAVKLFPISTRVVSNGIPDPCPQFESDVLPQRTRRTRARTRLFAGEKLDDDDIRNAGGDPHVCRILFLAHCMREKGLFDAVEGTRLAAKRLADIGSPVSLRIIVAGNFVNTGEKTEFDRLLAQDDLAGIVEYVGFVSGSRKERLLRESDLLCFPTFYQNENQPVNLIEAMAYGLPVITTRWRSLPEMFPADYPGLIRVKSPSDIADAVLVLLKANVSEILRHLFTRNFTLQSHLTGLAQAFHCVEGDQPDSFGVCQTARA